jgi:DhnA family fructose-bisphosphate aldolase class Ia
MMGSLGKAVRIGRLQNPASGRILTIAMDHAPSYGVLAGLEDIQATIRAVAAGGPDAMLLMKGTAERCFSPYVGRIALIMKCSTISPYHAGRDVLVTSVADALRLGADAVAMAVTVGSPQQAEILEGLSLLVREADRVGMPVIAHAYPCGELVPVEERYSMQRVRYASRLAMEIGVDIVKTFYTGSAASFAEVVKAAAPALVVAAGGPRLATAGDALRMAADVVEAGAAGITFGRNVWQHPDVPAMVAALTRVVHDLSPPEEEAARLERS